MRIGVGVGADLLRGLKPVLVINSELVLAISVNPLSVNPGGGVDLMRGLQPVLVINSELVLAISVNPLSVNQTC